HRANAMNPPAEAGSKWRRWVRQGAKPPCFHGICLCPAPHLLPIRDLGNELSDRERARALWGELVFENLAERIAGKRVDEVNEARALERGELLRGERE